MSILDMSVESEQETVNPYDKTRGPSDLKPSNKENHVKRGEFIMVAWRKLMAKYPHFREAYDAGDTEKIVEAQGAMNSAQLKLSQAQALKPQYTSQKQENSVESNQQPVRPQAPQPDARAQAWQANNTWFGKDEEMTSLALGVHERLVRSGINPTSDEYYRRIDETMQKRFPENFGETSLESDKPAQRKPSNVVAPATRSTAPKKVRLSKTQVAFAK